MTMTMTAMLDNDRPQMRPTRFSLSFAKHIPMQGKRWFRWKRIMVPVVAVLGMGRSFWLSGNFESSLMLSPSTNGETDATVVMRTPATKTRAPSIAYCISISFCQSGQVHSRASTHDGPAVLAHSIQQIHQHSKYDYKLYAFVFPDQSKVCSKHLEHYGYELLERGLPFDLQHLKETKPDFFRFMKTRGCCGAREFMKLFTFQLDQHDLVVHLDNDVLFLQPIDELFDAMLSTDATQFNNRIVTMGQRPLPTTIDAMFTRDYLQPNLNEPTAFEKFPVQGGFFLTKPNHTLYNEMVDSVRRGNFSLHSGWEGSKVGNFYGDAQIQGLLAYMWGYKYPQHAVELDRCLYNTHIEDDGILCQKSTQKQCNDCTQTPLDQIKWIHYTTCQKPWKCMLPWWKDPPTRCREGHRAWFQMRKAVEAKYGIPPAMLPSSSHEQEWTLGYCREYPSNETSYVPLGVPSMEDQQGKLL